jgi:hypothetical protein
MKSEIDALVDISLCSTMVPSGYPPGIGEKNLKKFSASASHWVMPLKWDVPKISIPQLYIKWALIYGTTHYEGVTLLLPSIVDWGSTNK